MRISTVSKNVLEGKKYRIDYSENEYWFCEYHDKLIKAYYLKWRYILLGK